MGKASIVGSGNVAWTLAKRMIQSGWVINEVYARDQSQGKSLAVELKASQVSAIDELNPKVDIIILAVSDDAIKPVAESLPNTKALVLHCSGSTPLSALPQASRGVIWPLRSISKTQDITWHDLNMVMETDTDKAKISCLDLISDLGAKAVQMSKQERLTAHLVAVIINNFSNHLLHMADVLCDSRQMDRKIFQDLMAHTLEYKGPAISSQTGPAARNDSHVIDRQLDLLDKFPHFQTVYRSMTDSIINSQNEQEL